MSLIQSIKSYFFTEQAPFAYSLGMAISQVSSHPNACYIYDSFLGHKKVDHLVLETMKNSFFKLDRGQLGLGFGILHNFRDIQAIENKNEQLEHLKNACFDQDQKKAFQNLQAYVVCGGSLKLLAKELEKQINDAPEDLDIQKHYGLLLAAAVRLKEQMFMEGQLTRPLLWQRVKFFVCNFFLVRWCIETDIQCAHRVLNQWIASHSPEAKNSLFTSFTDKQQQIHVPHSLVYSLWQQGAKRMDGNQSIIGWYICMEGNLPKFKEFLETTKFPEFSNSAVSSKKVISLDKFLLLCATTKNKEMTAYLLEKGAKTTPDTVLTAIKNDFAEGIQMFLDQKHINATDTMTFNNPPPQKNLTLTLLQIAIDQNAYKIAKLLLEKGADITVSYPHQTGQTSTTISHIKDKTLLSEIFFKDFGYLKEICLYPAPINHRALLQHLQQNPQLLLTHPKNTPQANPLRIALFYHDQRLGQAIKEQMTPETYQEAIKQLREEYCTGKTLQSVPNTIFVNSI